MVTGGDVRAGESWGMQSNHSRSWWHHWPDGQGERDEDRKGVGAENVAR